MANDLRPAFGAKVRTLRTALGLTQEQLAERAALHWTYVSGVERGVRNPGLNIIGKLASALEVEPKDLLTFTDKNAGALPGRRRR